MPDYGSAGSHCNIEIEADNSILDNAEDFLQRVKDAYEVARQSVEEELSHHRPGNTGQSNQESTQQRQEYRSNNSGNAQHVVSEKQLSCIWQLTKGIKGLDKRTLEKYCDSKFGKASSQLSTKEASQLIDDLKAAKEGRGGLAV